MKHARRALWLHLLRQECADPSVNAACNRGKTRHETRGLYNYTLFTGQNRLPTSLTQPPITAPAVGGWSDDLRPLCAWCLPPLEEPCCQKRMRGQVMIRVRAGVFSMLACVCVERVSGGFMSCLVNLYPPIRRLLRVDRRKLLFHGRHVQT